MKRVRYVDGALDALDTAILAALAEDARTPMRELAQKIGLSAPSTTERVRRLEAAGVIEGYTIRVNPSAIGLPLGAILRIRPMPGELNRVAEILAAIPEITSCDRVTGDDCFIAKAQVPSVADLESLIDGLLPYASTNTCVVVSKLVAQRQPAHRGDFTMTRRLISSGSQFERDIGYSRAVVDGDWIFVSGTTGFNYATMTISDNLLDQTDQCLKNIRAALVEAGADFADIVRVMYILPDAARFPDWLAHPAQIPGNRAPAATMISAGLSDPRMQIEIQVTARKRTP